MDKNNVFVDFSPSLLDEKIKRSALKILGAEKCLYGSDSPYGYPGNDGSHDYPRVLNGILRMPIPEADRARILGETFSELAGI